MDQKRLVRNQEEESSGRIPSDEGKIKNSCFLSGSREYYSSLSRSRSLRYYRFPILLPGHDDETRRSSRTAIDGDVSLKKLQEVQTPVSMEEEELDLSLSVSTNNKKRKMITAAENHPPKRPKLLVKLWRMRNYSKEDIAEEERLGVTTKLSLCDPWRMKKDLMQSDIGNLSRLMLKTDWAEKYFLPHLDIKQVESENGVPVRVLDLDTGTEHELAFKLWKSSGSYVLKKGWVKDFVRRRNLQKDDRIGLLCDEPLMGHPSHSTLKIYFRLLKRALPKQ